jgi:hypothetical protein
MTIASSGKRVGARCGDGPAHGRLHVCCVMAVCLVGVGACSRPEVGYAQTPDGIRRSDVAFARKADVETYRQYGATIVAWGFRPWHLTGEALLAEWKRDIERAHSVGARYQARVELDAGWRGMIDFDPRFREAACLDLEGNPITYPFWSSQYKGQPPYYFCTNAPGYREYLNHQAEEALVGEPDLLLIDAIHTTAASIHHGGCFCQHCMAGFRQFVLAEVPREVLRECGITEVEDLDYGRYLRGRGVTLTEFRDQVKRWPSKLPLAEEYLTYQQRAAREFLADFHRTADRIAGRAISLASSTALMQAKAWYPAAVIDHFTIETVLHPELGKISQDQVFRFKLADALGRRILVTGAPKNDWAYVRDHNLTGLVRAWIAQSYAYGHNFLVPHDVWCGEGATSYQSRPGDYDDLYRFVRRHATLLDEYEPVADVGLLYSHKAARRWRQQSKHAALELTRRNIPFRFIVAGDDWLPLELSRQDLEGLKALITTRPSYLTADQQQVLDTACDRLTEWPDFERLHSLVPPQIRADGATNVSVLPRAHAEDASAPGVCHVLNGNYSADQDAIVSTGTFRVRLADSVYGKRIEKVTFLSPGRPEASCDVQTDEDGVTVSVPSVEHWAILKLQWSKAE